MEIVSLKPEWLTSIKDIDFESHICPWDNEIWDNVGKYIVKVCVEDRFGSDILIGDNCYGFYVCKIVKDAVLILKLAVSPSQRGRGIGTSLLMDIVAMAVRRKLKLICLTVHEENTGGIAWARKNGFRGVEIIEGAYPDGRDGFTLYKVVKL